MQTKKFLVDKHQHLEAYRQDIRIFKSLWALQLLALKVLLILAKLASIRLG